MLYFEQAHAEAWLAAVDGNRAVVVDLADRPSDVPQLWMSLHADKGVRGILDHLTANGLSSAPGFILLEWEGEWASGATVRVIVRGDASVTLATATGSVVISGALVSTWTEQHIEAVAGFELTVGTEPGRGGIALPLGVGAAWTSRLSSSYFDVEQDATSSSLAAAPSPAAPSPAAPSPAAPTLAAAEPVAAPIGGFSEQTIMEVPGDEIDDATIIGRRDPSSAGTAPSAVDDSRAVLAPSEVGDHDGFTVMSGDLQKMRKQQAAANEQAVAAASAKTPARAETPVAKPLAPPRAMLRLPSGEIIGLEQPVLIGRAPSVTKVSGGAVPRIVSLGGVDQDISRNHVEVTVEGDTVVVTDLHSRNGTLIVLPGKSPQKLRSGEPTAVIVGTLIDLGGGIGITVGEE